MPALSNWSDDLNKGNYPGPPDFEEGSGVVNGGSR